MTVLPATQIYEGTRIPSPCPTILEIDPTKHALDDILTVNFGPNHPSTHGVLRLIVDLDGERIAGIRAVIGYLHTGFEKTMEHKTYWKGITYPERIDYLSFQSNELVFVLAIEKLLALETPEKATWMRMCLAELNRIHSHLVWLGTSALEIGAISMFWYAFRERDMILDLFEMVTGVRMHTRYFQVGGLAEDIPEGFYAQARAAAKRMPKAVDDYEGLLDRNKIWLERTKGIGLLSADDALALGQSGPMLRASGVDWDLRRATPYLAYDEVEFDVPVYQNGDVYDRYKVHMDEMRQSARIVTQCLDRLEALRGIAVDRRRPQGRAAAARGAPHLDGVAHPPLQDRHGGLPRPRGRGVRRDRVGARRAGAATSSRTAARSPGAFTSAPRASPRCRRPRRASAIARSPTWSPLPPRSTRSWETSTDERHLLRRGAEDAGAVPRSALGGAPGAAARAGARRRLAARGGVPRGRRGARA